MQNLKLGTLQNIIRNDWLEIRNWNIFRQKRHLKLLEKNLNTPEEIENNNVAINQWKNISFTNILLKIKNQEQVLCQ